MMLGVMSLMLALTLPVTEVIGVRDAALRRYPGRIVPVAQVNVVPQVSGEILEVGFANGQAVKHGDLLYRLDSVKYEAVVKNAEAKVRELKTQSEYADLSAQRYEQLVTTRAVSQDDLDHARATRDSVRASLAAAEADLLAARDDLKHCRLVAPITGKVGTTSLTEGNYVQKGAVTLVTLIQTAPIRVRFSLSSSDYHALFGSDPVRLVREGSADVRLMADGAISETGRIEYVENAADPLTDSIEVFALLDNAMGTLSCGQTVMVTLSNENGVIRAAIPPNALVRDLQGAYVWIVGVDGRAEQRRITCGAVQKDLLLVKSGLKVGERIVADGVHRVRTGMEIVAE